MLFTVRTISFLLCILLCWTGQVSAKSWELSFQSIIGPTHRMTREFLIPWTESFAEHSKGELKVNYFDVNAIVDILQTHKAVTDGMVDMAMFTPFDTRTFPYMQALNLPFATDSAVQASELFWKSYEELPEIRAEADKVGKTLVVAANAPFAFVSTKDPIRSPADIAGKRVIVASATNAAEITALGGTPVYVNNADIYVGLQRGMGDIAYNGILALHSLKIQELTSHITVFTTSRQPIIISMNQELAEDMPSELLTIVDQLSGLEPSRRSAAIMDEAATDAVKDFVAAGAQLAELTLEEVAAFCDKLLAPMTNYYLDSMEKAGVKDATAFFERVAAVADSL